jgi:hypothetical protein
MKNIFPKKKFILNQPIKEVDVRTELFVLEEMLRRLEKEEDYLMASVVYNRMESIKSSGT